MKIWNLCSMFLERQKLVGPTPARPLAHVERPQGVLIPERFSIPSRRVYLAFANRSQNRTAAPYSVAIRGAIGIKWIRIVSRQTGLAIRSHGDN